MHVKSKYIYETIEYCLIYIAILSLLILLMMKLQT